MRNLLFIVLGSLIFLACSAPKYTYNFDYYDYNSGRKSPLQKATTDALDQAKLDQTKEVSPIFTEQKDMVASTVATPDVTSTAIRTAPKEETQNLFARKYKSMTKEERKEFRHELKKEIKTYMKATKDGDHVAAAKATKAMDNDLRLAIIFGAVGLTLTLFGGVSQAFWVLGVISIVIGVVFLIKWLLRQ